jgi:hypothetical protein
MAELGLGELGASRNWPSILGKAVYRGANNGEYRGFVQPQWAWPTSLHLTTCQNRSRFHLF